MRGARGGLIFVGLLATLVACSTEEASVDDATPSTRTGDPTCAPGTTSCFTACVVLSNDRNHCGACGNACEAGAICADGACRCGSATGDVCAPRQGNVCTDDQRCRSERHVPGFLVEDFAIGASKLMIATASESLSHSRQAWFVDKASGAVTGATSMMATGNLPSRVASDGGEDFAFTTLYESGGTLDYFALWGCPAGACNEIVTGMTARDIRGLVVRNGYAFWPDRIGNVYRCAISGGSPGLYAMNALTNAYVLFDADETDLFFVDKNGYIGRLPASLGGQTAPVGQVPGASRMAIDPAGAGRIYFATPAGIMSCPKTGCTNNQAESFVAETMPITGMASDGTTVFWSTDERVSSCAAGASCAAPTTLFSSGKAVLGVDDTSLYLSTRSLDVVSK